MNRMRDIELFLRSEKFDGLLQRNVESIAQVAVEMSFNPFETSHMCARLTNIRPVSRESQRKLLYNQVYAVEGRNNENGIRIEFSASEGLDSLSAVWPPISIEHEVESIMFKHPPDFSPTSFQGRNRRHVWSYSLSPIGVIDSGWIAPAARDRSCRRMPDTGDLLFPGTAVHDFEIDGAKVSLYDTVHFSNKEAYVNDNEKGVCLSHPKITIAVETQDAGAIARSDVNDIAEAFQNFLSIMQHDWIRPFMLWELVIDDENLQSGSIITHIWKPDAEASPLRFTAWDIRRDKTQAVLMTMLQKWSGLSRQKKQDFAEVCNVLKVVFYASTIEDEFTKLHSLLDFLKKKLNHPGKPFSANLVLACDEAQVEFEDLFPIPKREELSRKKQPKAFRFTEIRNKFEHDGFEVDSYQEMVNLQYKMYALAERLILSFLNVNYKEMPVRTS